MLPSQASAHAGAVGEPAPKSTETVEHEQEVGTTPANSSNSFRPTTSWTKSEATHMEAIVTVTAVVRTGDVKGNN